jgi:hypothetical protein
MPYPQHWLLSFGGTAGDPADIWSCNLRLAITDFGTWSMDEENFLTNTAVPALTAWFATANAKISSSAVINYVKFNEIGPDGKYADPAKTHERLGLNIFGASGTTQLHPLQVCYVLSFRTALAERGPGSKGRMYVPRPNLPIGVNGDVTSSDRTAIAGAAKTFLEALHPQVGPPGSARIHPCIVTPLLGGVAHNIDRLVVDSALDIQRRRANKQTREETSVTIAQS